ncbi:MAG: M18 family aminopeptidase [Oscillospiraceae bacterium]|nr:M18 family aminopeptidase [Oscillospiraceae bacterium]
MDQRISGLCEFLDEAKSQYHAIDALCRRLREAGYRRLREEALWEPVAGGKYYMTRGGSSLIAFRVPQEAPQGYVMSASHCDRPTFLIRDGELTGRYTRLSTERYGGMLIHPWLDRPLSLAGRVLVETPEGVESRLVDIDRDLAMIPSLAIHMDRTANEGHKWDLQKELFPLLGSKSAAGKLKGLLEEAAGGKVLSHDLYLYVRQKATVWGVDEEYLSAPGLDDLECVWGCTMGFLEAKESRSIPVLCVFDCEEVGSSSPQGAGGTLLSDVLARISRSLGLDHDRMMANSFMVSADNAHAVHPNRPEMSDPCHGPELNGGVVIKTSASRSYTSDGLSTAVFRKLCKTAGVPVQTFHNRPDQRGGSTLGHVSWGHVSVPSVDIGLAQLAMHSCYETAGARDPGYLLEAMKACYSATIRCDGDGYVIE